MSSDLTFIRTLERPCGCKAKVKGKHFGKTRKLANKLERTSCGQCLKQGGSK